MPIASMESIAKVVREIASDYHCSGSDLAMTIGDAFERFADKLEHAEGPNTPVKAAGVDYSPTAIEGVRSGLINLRSTMVQHWPNRIEDTLTLSHAIALLTYLRDLERGT